MLECGPFDSVIRLDAHILRPRVCTAAGYITREKVCRSAAYYLLSSGLRTHSDRQSWEVESELGKKSFQRILHLKRLAFDSFHAFLCQNKIQ